MRDETFKQMLDRMIRNSQEMYRLTGDPHDWCNLQDLKNLRELYNKEQKKGD